jgi:hypothetical protein
MHKHLNVKTFFLALLLLNAFYTTAYSQSPTKEETIAFIQNTIEKGIGADVRGELHKVISKVKFEGNKLVYQTESLYDGKLTLEFIYESSTIRWDKYNSFEVKEATKDLVYITAYFTSNFKHTVTTKFHYEIADDKKREIMKSNLVFCVPSNKVESMKKAFVRLNEIALAEQKDPFE